MKKHMCRIFKDLLMVMLIFSLCMQTIPTSQALAADSSQKDAFKAELIQMFKTGDTTTHDISMYSLTYSEMNSIFTSVTKNECMIEYNCGSFIVTSTTRDSNDLLLTFRLANLDSDYLARLGRMKANIDAALAGISDKMSDLEKALYLHDYLLSICYYKSSSGLLCHSAGGILGNGEGVCQGYRLAYELLLTLAGVKATYLTSTKMNHSWNAVYLDGQYGEYSARICLNDYVDAFSETPLTVKISEENFRILVRELDVNGKFIKSVTLKDGDTYIPSANASTLGISVYCVVWTTLNYEKYMQKFDNGFEATLYGAKETTEDAAEDITQK